MTLSGHRAHNRSVSSLSAPSASEMSVGHGFPPGNQPNKGQIVIYRTSLGSRSPGVANCATVAGNRGEPSGESGFNVAITALMAPGLKLKQK